MKIANQVFVFLLKFQEYLFPSRTKGIFHLGPKRVVIALYRLRFYSKYVTLSCCTIGHSLSTETRKNRHLECPRFFFQVSLLPRHILNTLNCIIYDSHPKMYFGPRVRKMPLWLRNKYSHPLELDWAGFFPLKVRLFYKIKNERNSLTIKYTSSLLFISFTCTVLQNLFNLSY